MKISTFTESLSSTRLSANPTWLIDIYGKKLLFVCSKSDFFLKNLTSMGIDLNTIDLIILPAGCVEPIRELQHFLFSCPNADFYLPKASAQKYFYDTYNKLHGYFNTVIEGKILSRIHFVDDLCSITQNILLFGSDTYNPDMKEHKQSLLIQKDSHAVLFANTDTTASSLESIFHCVHGFTSLNIKYAYDRAGLHFMQKDILPHMQ